MDVEIRDITKEIKSLVSRKKKAKRKETKDKLTKIIKLLRKDLKQKRKEKKKRKKRRRKRETKKKTQTSIDTIIPLRGDPKIKKAIESSAPVQKALINAAIQDHFVPIQNKIGGNVFQPFNPQLNDSIISDISKKIDSLKTNQERMRETRTQREFENFRNMKTQLRNKNLVELNAILETIIPDEEERSNLFFNPPTKEQVVNFLVQEFDDHPILMSNIQRSRKSTSRESSLPKPFQSSLLSSSKKKKKKEEREEEGRQLKENQILSTIQGLTSNKLKSLLENAGGSRIKKAEAKTATIERILNLDLDRVLQILDDEDF